MNTWVGLSRDWAGVKKLFLCFVLFGPLSCGRRKTHKQILQRTPSLTISGLNCSCVLLFNVFCRYQEIGGDCSGGNSR